MILDPSGIETKLWSGEIANVASHRKGSYLFCMKLFCTKYLHGFRPDFWNLKTTEEDTESLKDNPMNDSAH